MNFGIMIQTVNDTKQFLLRCVFGQLIFFRIKADLLTCAAFVPHIDLRCGIFAHNNHSQSGYATGLLRQRCGFLCDFRTELSGNHFSINDHCQNSILPFLYECFSFPGARREKMSFYALQTIRRATFVLPSGKWS